MFFTIFLIFCGLQLYVFYGLYTATSATSHWKAWVELGFVILVTAGVLLTNRFTDIPFLKGLFVALFAMIFLAEILFLPFLLIDDLRRSGIWIVRLFRKKRIPVESRADTPSPVTSADPEPVKDKGIPRSEFLLKSGLAVAATPFLGLGWGMISGAYDYRVVHQKLYLPNLPKAFHGMTVGQISDIHSGSFYYKKAVLGGVEMLLKEKPDVIFFTGDLVNNLATEMKDYQDLFSKVKADLGVYSTLGNHDYGEYYFGHSDSPAKRKNLEDVIQTHAAMGWDLLMDEHRILKVDQEELCIVGVQNWGKGHFPKKGNLKKALAGTEDQTVKLLLSHDPSHWRAQVLDTDVDVMFAGHTHGMQFGVRLEGFQWSPIQYMYPEWAGLYREVNKQLYVNVGYGFLGYPGRLGILPEITIFELLSEPDPYWLKCADL